MRGAAKPLFSIRALDQVLETSVNITPDQTTSVSIGVDSGRFVIRK
jgi:hypothetical protein